MNWLRRIIFRPFVSKWVVFHYCLGCDAYLTREEVFRGGACPHCGLLADGTILDNRRIYARTVRDVAGGPIRLEKIRRPDYGEHQPGGPLR